MPQVLRQEILRWSFPIPAREGLSRAGGESGRVCGVSSILFGPSGTADAREDMPEGSARRPLDVHVRHLQDIVHQQTTAGSAS